MELVAGIETHVQLKTASKMFCGCAVRFGSPPNSLTCPVCLGHPGVLPVLNRKALELGMRAALALNCRIAPLTKFDRKNYYYPDLPKNYQISQFDVPLARDGWVEVRSEAQTRRVRIHRAHLEEDAGKLLHEEQGSRSFVDLNRAGVPLLEIVTEPDLRSSEEAYAYLSTLKSILRAVGVSDCDMEKGELRCDVNLSVRPPGSTALGVKTEIKNLNSFRYVQKALEAEFRRHVAELDAGRTIVQSTWLYDPDQDQTRLMRVKEFATDYRYFPEPDLPPLAIRDEEIEATRRSLPELPAARCDRFMREYGLSEYDAQALVSERVMADFFEDVSKATGKPKTAANWVVNEVARILNEKKAALEETRLAPSALSDILSLVEAGRVTAASGKEILAHCVDTGRPPAELMKELGLEIVTDTDEIERTLDGIIAANPKAVADFKGGKDATMKFLVGQVMKATKGRVQAPKAEELLRKKLR
ncbi:MAG: Asp-tRNA(Asn)/Glu-tRNA(Gln) amidotransferase subunit GatB [Planctomycetes bacterium]|nr:Asp-tRNA(Asn)/Glu-tRNA(Gln) amidotransferase subunit GatB [Planctomycetota bacterium]